jgi:hypothetical protein
VTGVPVEKRICTSHVERREQDDGMQIRRLTRLTDGHRKKWENHEAALAVFLAYYVSAAYTRPSKEQQRVRLVLHRKCGAWKGCLKRPAASWYDSPHETRTVQVSQGHGLGCLRLSDLYGDCA